MSSNLYIYILLIIICIKCSPKLDGHNINAENKIQRNKGTKRIYKINKENTDKICKINKENTDKICKINKENTDKICKINKENIDEICKINKENIDEICKINVSIQSEQEKIIFKVDSKAYIKCASTKKKYKKYIKTIIDKVDKNTNLIKNIKTDLLDEDQKRILNEQNAMVDFSYFEIELYKLDCMFNLLITTSPTKILKNEIELIKEDIEKINKIKKISDSFLDHNVLNLNCSIEKIENEFNKINKDYLPPHLKTVINNLYKDGFIRKFKKRVKKTIRNLKIQQYVKTNLYSEDAIGFAGYDEVCATTYDVILHHPNKLNTGAVLSYLHAQIRKQKYPKKEKWWKRKWEIEFRKMDSSKWTVGRLW